LSKKVLIISPHLPPLNAADMQRIRMSLPYFKQFGWDAEVVTVDASFSEIVRDNLLLQSIPADIKIHKVNAFNKSWTSKLGLGSLALRSLWFYRRKVNQLLKETHFDLIYFSTTQFPVCILGAGWKKRFGVPYVIDMQDPWHSEYYRDKPSDQQPSKYWFSYRLHKFLEPIAMRNVDGLISVSENYISDLKTMYPLIKNIPAATITFGAFAADLKIAEDNCLQFTPLLDPQFTNIVYVGRGGADMHQAITVLFKTLKDGLDSEPQIFNKIKIHFIGTSYAPNGQGKPTILPLAKQFGIENNIVEITDRISYYHTLITLQQADALFIPGSDDPKYTASKIYPYLLTRKPLLAIFNAKSSAIGVLKEYGVEHVYGFNSGNDVDVKIYNFLKRVVSHDIKEYDYNANAVKKYSAENRTGQQCLLFQAVINGKN
jgi:Glycosyltransferase Family 4